MEENILIPKKRVLGYLRGDIDEQIKDEASARDKYREMAEMARLLNLSSEASTLEKISQDEDGHHGALIDMLRRLPSSD